MKKTFCQIVALVCLVALVCGGQLDACACDTTGPQTACESHDHSHEDHNTTSSTSETDCPCLTCHFCPHGVVALLTSMPALPMQAHGLDANEIVARLAFQPVEIFIPPKLS